jgi:hypothetical protein
MKVREKQWSMRIFGALCAGRTFKWGGDVWMKSDHESTAMNLTGNAGCVQLFHSDTLVETRTYELNEVDNDE